MTPGHTWLGRILVVNHPSTVTIQHAVLLSVGVGDAITLLGAPFWIWHTDDLLEDSCVVPATTYNPGVTLEDDMLPLLGLMQVSRLLPPGSLGPNTLDQRRHPGHLGK